MQCFDNFDDRVDALLRRIAKAAERRDQILDDVSQAVSDTGNLAACVEEVRAVSRRMLLSFADKSADLACTITASASLAERSSRRVKRLDMLLRRVREAKVVADSLYEMRRTVTGVGETIDTGDLDRMVELIRRYEEASANLGGEAPPSLLQDDNDDDSEDSDGAAKNNGDVVSTSNSGMVTNKQKAGDGEGENDVKDAAGRPPTSSSHYSPHSDGGKLKGSTGHEKGDQPRREASSVIASARELAREKLLEKFRAAARANDKLTIMHTTRLLTQLGLQEEGCSLYCTWLCEHTIAALKKIVERELRKMDDPNEAGMSHLGLVSSVLDVVVAAFENEEEFMRETFGDAGLLKLLTELHTKSTSQCVPVLKDFLKKRQEVLSSITAASSRNNVNGGNHLHGDSSYSLNVVGDAAGGVVAGSSSPSSSELGSVDPRRTDQILEEMSHLVSCCHLYWAFVQSKQREYMQSIEGANKSQDQQGGMVSVDSLWSSHDNPLMNTVQEILAVFVPLQRLYFDAAFDQVLRLQMDALRAATGREASLQGTDGGNMKHNNIHSHGGKKNETLYTSPSTKKAATFMTGLAALYTSTGGSEEGEDEFYMSSDQVPITLPDDVFFFFRIAVHRAVNTKSTQILSAVFIACIEVVQSQLTPVLQLHTTLPPPAQLQQLQQHCPELTVPSRVLRWTSAAHQTVMYTRKLADELRKLARANFSVKDLLRFTEQAEDMDAAARELHTSVEQSVAKFAEVYYQAHIAPHLERFCALTYNFAEDVFYHYELSDPWAQACVAAADVSLRPFDKFLDAHPFDLFLLAIVRQVVRTLWQALLQKSFSGYGALQIDRDVRTLRTFFLARAHELQLREPFLPLTCATSLLLLDAPKDAEQDVYEGLTADEKKQVLCCRAEFKRAEIERLRL